MAMQHVILMHMWKWWSVVMMVSILRLRELNVQGKKAAEMSEKERGKKKVEGIPISVAQAQVQQGAERDFIQNTTKGKV